MSRLKVPGGQLVVISAALAAMGGPARAGEAEDVKALRSPDSRIAIGAGFIDNAPGDYGKYNGIDEESVIPLLDIDMNMREQNSGTWLRLRVRNPALDSRELRLEHERQGSWGYYLEYNEIPRFEPFEVSTSVVGIGGSNLSNGAAESDKEFKSKRQRLDFGLDRQMGGRWGFSFDFRNEEKHGERISGVGTPGGNQFNFAPEPLDSTISLIEGTLHYGGDSFQLVGGYYGTLYRNDHSRLTWDYGTAGLQALSPLALPPDNESHQAHVSGGYSFSPTMRGTFKAAYSVATQDDNFILPSISGRTDLGGRIVTTMLQAGLSARPMPKLSVTGNFRHEDRDDQTPAVQYIVPAGGNNTWDGFNEPRDIRTTYGKLEASYALPRGYRVIGDIQYEIKERNTIAYRSVSHRDETDEVTYSIALRRSMAETLTGGFSFAHSVRRGSAFDRNILFDSNATGSNVYAPLHYADRDRDKARLSLNWFPTDPLSVQFYLDLVNERYEGDRDGSGSGPRDGRQRTFALDAAYRFSENWQASAWYNRNVYRWENEMPGVARDTSTNEGDAFGVGVRGKLRGRLDAGLDFSFSEIKDEWEQDSLSGVPVSPQLPVSTTRHARMNLFGEYALEEHAGLRVDYVYDRHTTNDPAWSEWGPGGTGSYSDGTLIREPSPQRVHFIGFRYFYRFR